MKKFKVTGNVRYKFVAEVTATDELKALEEIKQLAKDKRLKLDEPVGIPNVKIVSVTPEQTETP